jgi:hypothetical protein
MMQMFTYPQGEGGCVAPHHECTPERGRNNLHPSSLLSPPLLSRFVPRLLTRQTTVSMGGTVYGD